MARGQVTEDRMLSAMGALHCVGLPVDLLAVNQISEGDSTCLSDMPEYPFNHSKSYWHESQISREHRFRKHARHDFLGLRTPAWTSLTPRWRHVVRTLENPWIEDHVIGGAMIYPGAGMIVMAIEAAAQYTADLRSDMPDAFKLKDINFKSAVNVSSNTGTTAEIALLPKNEEHHSDGCPKTLQFTITVYEDEHWREVCNGTVSTHYNDEDSIHHAQERQCDMDRLVDGSQAQLAQCRIPIGRSKLYKRFQATGLQFGPIFHVFDDVKYNWQGGLASTLIRLRNWELKAYPSHTSPHIIHPTALDGVLQLPVVALGAGRGRKVPTMVPSKIDSLWINSRAFAAASQSRHMAAVAHADYLGFRNAVSEVTAYSQDTLEPMVVARGLETAIINSSASPQQAVQPQQYYHLAWKPDLQHNTDDSIQRSCDAGEHAENTKEPFVKWLELFLHENSAANILEIFQSESDEPLLQELLDAQSQCFNGRYEVIVQDALSPTAGSPVTAEKGQSNGIGEPRQIRDTSVQDGFAYDLLVARCKSSDAYSMSNMAEQLLLPGGRLVTLGDPSPERSWLKSDEFEEVLATVLRDGTQLAVHRRTRRQLDQPAPTKPIRLMLDSSSRAGAKALSGIADILKASGHDNVHVATFDDAQQAETVSDAHIVYFAARKPDEPESGTDDIFLRLQWLQKQVRCNNIMWVTVGSELSGAMVTGTARTLRNEFQDLTITTLSISSGNALLDQDAAQAVGGVVREHCRDQGRGQDLKLIMRNGRPELHVPRLVPAPTPSARISDSADAQDTNSPPFAIDQGVNNMLTIGTPGLLETLRIVQEPVTQQPLLPEEIVVRPAFAGLNFLNVLTALGRIPQISVLGVEGAGTVVAAGTKSDLKPGDRVVVLTDGVLRSWVRTDYRTAARIPDDLSFADAAGIPGAACTAYRALIDVAHLDSSDYVLIHAGAGATGQMAIQIAQHIGAEVFVTVGSEAKRKLLETQYTIPSDHILHSRDNSFIPALKRMTGGRGVDVVLNSLAGSLLLDAWSELMAPFGRWVEIGKRDILENQGLAMKPFLQNVSFSCVDLSGIWRQRASVMRKLLVSVLRLVSSGAVRPVHPVNEFTIERAEDAFRRLQNGKTGGKVIIKMQDDQAGHGAWSNIIKTAVQSRSELPDHWWLRRTL